VKDEFRKQGQKWRWLWIREWRLKVKFKFKVKLKLKESEIQRMVAERMTTSRDETKGKEVK
jgi:hypothetical protein